MIVQLYILTSGSKIFSRWQALDLLEIYIHK
jgi:hypothetical protein